jgi:hypothetical protein
LISSDTQPVPEYYIHFTIARFFDGQYNTLEYDYNKKISDFKEELALIPGSYMIVTGNRLNDSKILSTISFFDMNENEHKTLKLSLRKDVSEKQLSVKLDTRNILKLFDGNNILGEKLMQKGAVLLWIDQEKEPSKHIFNDLPLLKKELDEWGGDFLFLSGSASDTIAFKAREIKGLPENSFFGIDNNMQLLASIKTATDLPEISLPFIIVTDRNSNIIFKSAGYRIGIGEQILKCVR